MALQYRLVRRMKFKLFRVVAHIAWALLATNYVAAQEALTAPSVTSTESRSIDDWLKRMHEASKNRAYVGTFVVSSGEAMSSAKIWHACEGNQQVERVETLTGAPRSIFRHNDQVVTFMPEQKVVRREKRESLGLFPGMLQSADSRIADFYKVRQEGVERVAGIDADIIVLVPKDKLRFGYRVWTEQKNGLVVKLQTLDTEGQVLEQAAFSELQLDAPVKMDQILQMMRKVDGYRIEKPALVKTTARAEGWLLKAPIPGFNSVSCYKRPAVQAIAPAGQEPMQWIFSDGLASVSIFVEPFDRQRHGKPSSLSMGATQATTRQLDGYWITVMGEAPLTSLKLFANNLERRK